MVVIELYCDGPGHVRHASALRGRKERRDFGWLLLDGDAAARYRHHHCCWVAVHSKHAVAVDAVVEILIDSAGAQRDAAKLPLKWVAHPAGNGRPLDGPSGRGGSRTCDTPPQSLCKPHRLLGGFSDK